MPPAKPTNSDFEWDRPLSGEVIDASPDRIVAAIVPGRMVAGIHAPGHVKKDPTRTTYDWRKTAWSVENRAGIRALSEIGELRELLLCAHTEFAHLVTYIIVHEADGTIEDSCIRTGSLWQPRVNKSSDALGWLRSQGLDVWAVVICLDMDTPGHVPWTPELRAKALALIEKSKLLLTCCWYWTTAGLRAVQPIFHIPVDKLEPLLREWLEALKKEGFDVDFACVDWTRLMKMPKTFNPKTGERVDFEPQNLDGMKKIDLEALLDGIYGNPDPADTRPRRERVAVFKKPKKEKTPVEDDEEEEEDPPDAPPDVKARPARFRKKYDPPEPGHDYDADEGDPEDLNANGAINFGAALPEIWRYRAKAIGREIFEVTEAGKTRPDNKHLSHHDLYRAIAGALRTQDVPGIRGGVPLVKRRFIPGIIRLIAQYAKEPPSRIEDDFVRSARELIQRKQLGDHTPGTKFLKSHWPTVNAVIVQETLRPNESVGYAWEGAGKMVEILSTDEAYAKLEAAVRNAPDGVSGIGAGAGLGKTKLTIDLALEHMRKKSINPETGRSQRGGKSGATFDKHTLAIQVRNDAIRPESDARFRRLLSRRRPSERAGL